MRFKYSGSKKDVGIVTIKNADTITIKGGAPVALAANATDDGLAVVSVNNFAAAKNGFFFGFATSDIAAGSFGEAQVFGYFDYARVRTATRSDSAAVWASYPAGVLGDWLGLCTGTGGAAGSIAADQAVSRLAAGAALSVSGLWPIVLGSAYASATTQASSLAGGLITDASATASISAMKILVRSF